MKSYNYGHDLFCANVCNFGDTELQANKFQVFDAFFMSYSTVNKSLGKCLLFHENAKGSST